MSHLSGKARPRHREAALGRLLLEGVPEGGGVTRVVRNLHELALRDPRAFTCTIARAFPGFAELRGNGPRDESPLRATAGAGTFASLVSAAEARARPHPEALAFVSVRAFGGYTEKWRSEEGDSPRRDLFDPRCIAEVFLVSTSSPFRRPAETLPHYAPSCACSVPTGLSSSPT